MDEDPAASTGLGRKRLSGDNCRCFTGVYAVDLVRCVAELTRMGSTSSTTALVQFTCPYARKDPQTKIRDPMIRSAIDSIRFETFLKRGFHVLERDVFTGNLDLISGSKTCDAATPQRGNTTTNRRDSHEDGSFRVPLGACLPACVRLRGEQSGAPAAGKELLRRTSNFSPEHEGRPKPQGESKQRALSSSSECPLKRHWYSSSSSVHRHSPYLPSPRDCCDQIQRGRDSLCQRCVFVCNVGSTF